MSHLRTEAALAVLGATAAVLMASGCATTATTSAAQPAGTSGADAFTIVGLGDSIQTSTNGAGNTFLDVYGDHIHTATGVKVGVKSFADEANTSGIVLDSLRTRTSPEASAVAEAHLVVITVGGNDGDPFARHPVGTCRARAPWRDCLASYAPDLESNLRRVLAKVDQLKPSDAAVVLTSPDFNPFVGWSEAPTRTFGVDFYRQVAAAETALVCRLAHEHHARCLDFLHLFNGPHGAADAAPYLAADHAHPGPRGIGVLADALAEVLDQ